VNANAFARGSQISALIANAMLLLLRAGTVRRPFRMQWVGIRADYPPAKAGVKPIWA
jgi:hypothetical protein